MDVRLELFTEMNIPYEDCDFLVFYTVYFGRQVGLHIRTPPSWYKNVDFEMPQELQEFPASIYHDKQKAHKSRLSIVNPM